MIINLEKLQKQDIIFKKELYDTFETVKKLVLCDLSNELVEIELKKIADNFLLKVKNLDIPYRPPNPETDYSSEIYSVAIKLPYGCFMVPYSIYQTYQESPDIDFDEEFSQDVTWLELIKLINQKRLDQRKKLTKTSVLICKVLSRYGSHNQAFKFPITSEIISNRTRQSLSIVRRTYIDLILKGIARDFFLINPWKIGWELYVAIYSFKEDINLDINPDITIAKEICSDGTMFKVIQLPMVKDSFLLDDLYTKLDSVKGSLFLLDSISYNWDLSHLQIKEEKSFANPPNFNNAFLEERVPDISFSYDDESLDWLSNKIISNNKKLNKKISVESPPGQNFSVTDLKKQRILNVLNYLIEFGAPMINFETTAKQIGISLDEFKAILQFLIKKRVIALAHRFKYIGAGREYSFIIEHPTPDLIHTIKQSLLRCVFSYFYEGKELLVGRVQVPNLWVSNFIEFFTKIQYKYPTIHISFGQRVLTHNFFKPNVSLSQNYILNEFGMQSIGK